MMANATYRHYRPLLEGRIPSRPYFLVQRNWEANKYSVGNMMSNSYESDTTTSDQDGVDCSIRNEDDNNTAVDAALLLASLANKADKFISKSQSSTVDSPDPVVSSKFSQLCSMSELEYQHELEHGRDSALKNLQPKTEDVLNECSTKDMNDDGLRIRAVSVDRSGQTFPPYESLKDYMNDHPTTVNEKKRRQCGTTTVSPPSSPRDSQAFESNCKRLRPKPVLDPRKRFCLRKQLQQEHEKLGSKCAHEEKKKREKNGLVLRSMIGKRDPPSTSYFTKGQLQPKLATLLPSQNNTTILRRKFSWKNYPELEAFLIANREEYLRHSALNYTTQQKQYNNKLTERLIELASSHGYVFDKEAFSFVTVRDRIRCYYKSYVQSSKKRGLIIGYAARKAGLLTDDDLQRSARVEGRIIIPEV